MPPNTTSWRSSLILSSHLRLGLPSGLFPSGFFTKRTVFISLVPHTCYMPHPYHASLFDDSNKILWGEQIISSSLCSLLHSPVASSLLSPNILLNTLLSNSHSLRSSLNDQVSHPYKTNRQNYSSVNLHPYIFWSQNARQKILHRMMASIPNNNDYNNSYNNNNNNHCTHYS